MAQPIHLGRHICGSLGSSLGRPQFPDHLIPRHTSLRIDPLMQNVLMQNLQQLPELALTRETPAAQNSVDLLADSTGIHSSTDTIIIRTANTPSLDKIRGYP